MVSKETYLSGFSSLLSEHDFPVIDLEKITGKGLCSCGKPQCSSPGKHPKTKWKGFINTNFNLDCKTKNIGVKTGLKSIKNNKYLLVIDIDSKDENLLKQFPKTFGYKTGKGGFHLWFFTTKPVKNTVKLLGPQIDTRGYGGYVVVPPSNHLQGCYSFEPSLLNGFVIVDLPETITNQLQQNHSHIKPQRNKKTAKQQPFKANNLLLFGWCNNTVQNVRERLLKGDKIPLGTRNVVLHRLLSSDRAKGATFKEIHENGLNYRQQVEAPETFSLQELNGIIKSVMSYQPYNTQHENVNKNYVAWLKKKSIPTSDGFAKQLEELDNLWFASLKPTDGKTNKIGIKELVAKREQFLRSKGLTHISNYKLSLLGKKLRELGFKRKKTTTNNYWCIEVSVVEQPPQNKAESRLENNEQQQQANSPTKECIHQYSSGTSNKKQCKNSDCVGFLCKRHTRRSGVNNRSVNYSSSPRTSFVSNTQQFFDPKPP